MTRRRQAGEVSVEEARELLRLFDESCLVELEAVWNSGRVSLRKSTRPGDGTSSGPIDRVDAGGGNEPSPELGVVLVSSPTVGRFWRGSGAGADAFVARGQHVQGGQQMAIVESLAAPVEILAERAGEVLQILAEDGQAVGYGDPLFALRAENA